MAGKGNLGHYTERYSMIFKRSPRRINPYWLGYVYLDIEGPRVWLKKRKQSPHLPPGRLYWGYTRRINDEKHTQLTRKEVLTWLRAETLKSVLKGKG